MLTRKSNLNNEIAQYQALLLLFHLLMKLCQIGNDFLVWQFSVGLFSKLGTSQLNRNTRRIGV